MTLTTRGRDYTSSNKATFVLKLECGEETEVTNYPERVQLKGTKFYCRTHRHWTRITERTIKNEPSM
jgi:hypothetical protein